MFIRTFPGWWLIEIGLPFVLTRLMLWLAAWAAFHFIHLRSGYDGAWEIGADGRPHSLGQGHVSGIYPFVNMWSRWDGGWYLEIAKSGYQFVPGKPSSSAFFPLYPVLVRGLASLFHLPPTDYFLLLTGIIVSNTCLLVALTYLRLLLQLDYPATVSSRCILYLLIFPTTVFYSSVYTESLFLACAVGAFYYARQNRWLLACALAASATLTRSQGIILTIPLLAEYLNQRSFRKLDLSVLSFLLIPAALGAFAWYLRVQFGTWDVMFQAQQPWGRHLMWPWRTLSWVWHSVKSGGAKPNDLIDLAFFVVLVVATLAGTALLRLSYSVYLWVSIAFFSAWGMLGSVPRFVLVVFPMFLVAALLTDKRPLLHKSILVVFFALALVFMVMQSLWQWVA